VGQPADSAGCTRDLRFLQKLGMNAIRAYSVDSSLNHDACMVMLSGAGIYVMCVSKSSLMPSFSVGLMLGCILDLTLPLNGSIDTNIPARGTNVLDQVYCVSSPPPPFVWMN
jgi:hypothetical protein